MKKYAIISNKGEVETEAFDSIGLSTKRNNNAQIGRFGSGNKYSIAYMLRKNLDIRVFSGEKEIVFTVQAGEFRGTPYQKIYVNGEKTSMTTDMGPDWKFWFCLREFYCNAIDEGDYSIMFANEEGNGEVINEVAIYGVAGTTKIYMELPSDFSMDAWDSLFSEDRQSICVGVDTSGRSYEIYNRLASKGGLLYHKGIRCIADEEVLNSIYDYSYAGFEINESRVVSGNWSVKRAIARILNTIADPIVINTILRNLVKPSIERDAMIEDFKLTEHTTWYSIISEMDIVVEEIAGRYLDMKDFEKYVQIPYKICKIINEAMPSKRILGMMKTIAGDTDISELADDDIPKRLKFMVETTIKDMKEQFKYHIAYPVKFFSSPWSGTGNSRSLKQGYADMESKTIYINIEMVAFGKKDIALTLLEENEHLISKASDETRGLQDHLFRMIITMMEDNSGFFL